MYRSIALLITCLLLCASSAFARITLPAIFGDHMVLQQQSPTRWWGTARPSATVRITVSWDKSVYTLKADRNGHWKGVINTPAAGGPHTIALDDGEDKRVISDVLIGEVWLCAGQSNMEMPVMGGRNQPVLLADEILLNSHQPSIRLFHIKKNISDTPLTDCDAVWAPSTPAAVGSFSAVAYLFARQLQEKLGVPVGVIQAAYGATMIESWMSREALQAFPPMQPLDALNLQQAAHNHPAVAFHAMIHPIAGFAIRGTLWYQGEQNAGQPAKYRELLAAMVKDWRRRWEMGDWPFYYVQIAPFPYVRAGDKVPYLREAQQQAEQDIVNSGMAVSIDAGSRFTVHPPDKQVISKRLLCLALAGTYGWKGLPHRGPAFRKMEIKDNTVQLFFDHAKHGLTAYDQPLSCFEIAGEDRIFYPAKAVINAGGVRLEAEQVTAPVAVRYAFKDWVKGDLYNTAGFPAAPFRTDDW
ncbi:sialate O-acetylesterase [Chitinophaga cymbidii]|nr:sialate O-acetylesterase [Chitinophaga cymbidii]